MRQLGIPLAKRTLLTIGDEARVFKLSGGKFDGKIERLTEITNNPYATEFIIRYSYQMAFGNSIASVDRPLFPTYATYSTLKFLSLKLAKFLFPDNFIDCSDLLFFRMYGRKFSAIYSDFIPDTNGVIERRTNSMRRYYLSEDSQIIQQSDETEHRLVPYLSEIIAKIHKSGLVIPHPEANYHKDGSRIVFFEIQHISIHSLVEFLKSKDSEFQLECLRWLSIILSMYFRFLEYFYKNENSDKTPSLLKPRNYLDYIFTSLSSGKLAFLESTSKGSSSMLDNTIYCFSQKRSSDEIKIPKNFYAMAQMYDPFFVEEI